MLDSTASESEFPADGSQTSRSTDAVPLVDIEFVDELPGGKVVMPVECEGHFAWLVVRGHMSPQARQEMRDDLNNIVSTGLWRQNWQPPQTEP